MALEENSNPPSVIMIETDNLQALIAALLKQDYAVYGPTVEQRAITYNRIAEVNQLPVGMKDEQSGGSYRLVKSDRPAYFDYVVGPQGWKRILYPPERRLWQIEKTNRAFSAPTSHGDGQSKLALFGVRPCELAAINVQDGVLANGEYVDECYRQMRECCFIVAVNCARPGGTCFCTSMGTGPKATGGYDLALTEVFDGDRHFFLAVSGSDRGTKLLSAIPSRPASEKEQAAAAGVLKRAETSMGRQLETTNLHETLLSRFDDPHWEEIAQRCLTCGNCTMVCPTCFCSNVEDITDLAGTTAERRRRWDSCYSVAFSYIHGGSIRVSPYARYRQWLMHKLVYWQDQFGMLGCVGCGRCITWCPVGIDITEEARTLTSGKKESKGQGG